MYPEPQGTLYNHRPPPPQFVKSSIHLISVKCNFFLVMKLSFVCQCEFDPENCTVVCLWCELIKKHLLISSKRGLQLLSLFNTKFLGRPNI